MVTRSSEGLHLQLGCPFKCDGYLCVDLSPIDEGVVRSEAVQWLETHAACYSEIKATNLLEHLPDAGRFFLACRQALVSGGKLMVRTDNAAWLPFYLPIIKRWGFAAHACDDYKPSRMDAVHHYHVFSKMHLRHFCELAGLKVLRISWTTWGARLLLDAQKA